MREAEEAGREIVQTVVWVVGLSSGLLALLAARPQILAGLSPPALGVLTSALAAAVAFGVLQRIVYQLTAWADRSHFRGLTTYLMGVTADLNLPTDFSDYWDAAEIVRRLRQDFDLDYGFLLEQDVPLKACQDAYKRQYELWTEHDL